MLDSNPGSSSVLCLKHPQQVAPRHTEPLGEVCLVFPQPRTDPDPPLPFLGPLCPNSLEI